MKEGGGIYPGNYSRYEFRPWGEFGECLREILGFFF